MFRILPKLKIQDLISLAQAIDSGRLKPNGADISLTTLGFGKFASDIAFDLKLICVISFLRRLSHSNIKDFCLS